jgi:hypothetical protein
MSSASASVGYLHVSTGALKVALNVWSHVIAVNRGTRIASGFDLYINGVNPGITTISNTLGTGTIIPATSMNLGRDRYGDIWTGGLDEIAFWLKAFDATEAAELWDLYNVGDGNLNDHSASAIYGENWYRMGDGDTYPTVIDVWGGVNGTMTNMEAGDIVADVM